MLKIGIIFLFKVFSLSTKGFGLLDKLTILDDQRLNLFTLKCCSSDVATSWIRFTIETYPYFSERKSLLTLKFTPVLFETYCMHVKSLNTSFFNYL